jgi:hypothetical protein
MFGNGTARNKQEHINEEYYSVCDILVLKTAWKEHLKADEKRYAQ